MNLLADPPRFWVCPERSSFFTEVVAAVSVADIHPRIPLDEPLDRLTVHLDGCVMDEVGLTVVPCPSPVGHRVWYWLCPTCHRRARVLYAREPAAFACRTCSGLRYISDTWTSASRLMAHYGRERERWEQYQRRGPKPQHYWSVVAREQRAVRAFLSQLDRARGQR